MTRAGGAGGGATTPCSSMRFRRWTSSISASRATAQTSVTRARRSAHEAEQRVDPPHARPRQGAVEQRRGVAPDHLAGGVGLAAERVDVAHRVDAALDRIIAGVDRLAAGGLRGCVLISSPAHRSGRSARRRAR